MPHKGDISDQTNKTSVKSAGFTCVGEYGTIAIVQTGTTVIASDSHFL